MKCVRRKCLQPSRVLLLLSVMFLFNFYQPTISASVHETFPSPQVGEGFGEDSDEGVGEMTKGTSQEETLRTAHGLESAGQTTAQMHTVYQPDTSDHQESNLTESTPCPKHTIVHCPSATSEPATTITPALPDPVPYVRSKYPTDLFSVEDRGRGWVILHIIGMTYMFISLAIVCDEFFVPALQVITDKLAISDEVTGATFMAAGSSAPKFFATIIGVFLAHNNVGVGQIVFSAAFNLLFVIGMCAVFSREVLRLTWWPLFRDVSFYIFDLILLIIFFLDNVITWWESMMLVTSYSLYVIFMTFNVQIERAFKRNHHNHRDILMVFDVEEQEKECVPTGQDGSEDSKSVLGPEDDIHKDGRDSVKNDCENLVKEEREEEKEKGTTDRPLSLNWPDTLLKQATYLLLLPIIFPLWLTIPDVRNQKSRKLVVITFLGSILWIAVFSYFMVWWAHQVGETIGIPDHIMTPLAAELSMPDLITSVIVARKGRGDMAVSSSMGRNIFCITLGLAVPWLLLSSFSGFAPVPVSSSGFFCIVVLLLFPLLSVIISVASCKWKMSKVLGFTMLLFYLIFQAIRFMFHYRFIVCPV
ncbi:sodium/potassium/calcium exchanger 1-like [Labrus bergylta]|uniref:sodium/potassium/calcium exchanger 1-like n=1 Tax=Labrus bergylta TaxID=56723 RepID=UPI0033130AD8